MKITSRQYAASLLEVIAENPKKEKEYLDSFLKILEANNSIKILPYIIEDIKNIGEEKSGFKRATAVSAVVLSAETKELIIKKLEKFFKIKIKLSEKVDSKILGGLILEAGDQVLDASISTAINKFKHSLSN